MRTDKELFQQIGLKNRPALELLYDRYEKSLYLLLTRMLPDEHRIQVALKQIFYDIWTDPNRFPSMHGYLIAAVKKIKSQREPVI